MNMRIDKKISKDTVMVEMTTQEYDAFVRLMKAMDNHLKDYKGGK